MSVVPWTKATLAGWGVPWPPPSGWRSQLVANCRSAHLAPDSDYRERDDVFPEEITAAQTSACGVDQGHPGGVGGTVAAPAGWKATLGANWERPPDMIILICAHSRPPSRGQDLPAHRRRATAMVSGELRDQNGA
jgi:hypothetical protein